MISDGSACLMQSWKNKRIIFERSTADFVLPIFVALHVCLLGLCLRLHGSSFLGPYSHELWGGG